MKKIVDFLKKDESWFWIAIFMALLIILSVIAYMANIFHIEGQTLDFLKYCITPLFAGIAFAVGFSLTIRRTNAIEHQAKATNEEIKQRKLELEQNRTLLKAELAARRFERTRKNLQALDEGGVMANDAIFDLMEEVYELDKTSDTYLHELQRYVSTFCVYLQQNTLKRGKNPFEIDQIWRGDNASSPLWSTQKIVDLLYPKKGKEETGICDNPFHSHIDNLKIDLTFCDLQKIDFSNRIIKNTDFGGAVMHNAKMHDSKFEKCNFWGTYLQSTNFSNSIISECCFWDAKLVWANLFNVNLSNCDFYSSDFSASLLTSADIADNCIFKNAIIDGADIYIQEEKPRLLSNPHSEQLGITSASFAFIYPLEHDTDSNKSCIESSETIHKKPLNKFERYIEYLEIIKGDINSRKTTLDEYVVRENKDKLLELCHKALKYAVIDEGVGLNSNNYKKYCQKINELITDINLKVQ